MGKVRIPYGEKDLLFQIPDKNLALLFDPPFPSPIGDLPGEIRQALESPESGPSFSRQLGKGKKVILLIDNFARLTPASRILPVLSFLRPISRAPCACAMASPPTPGLR